MAKPKAQPKPQADFRPLWLSLALVAITLALYWQVRAHLYVNYDDPLYVTGNRMVQKGLTAEGVEWAFTTGFASNWHPLTWLSHMLDVEMFGVKPGPHHLVNIFIHAANTVLLFLVLRLMTGSVWRSAFVAALFAWHPLHVESVAWVAERKDVLSTFFGLLTIGAYTMHARNSKRSHYVLALIFFALGLMAKPMLVTLPCVLLLLDYWPLKRWGSHPAKETPSVSKSQKNAPTTPPTAASPMDWRVLGKLAVQKWPFFALAFASCVATVIAQRVELISVEKMSLTMRISNSLIAYVRYLGMTVWPVDLAVLYPLPKSWPIWMACSAATLLIGVTALVVRFGKRFPYLPVGWFWYLGTLVPVIGIVQVGAQALADRYSYVPLIGIFIAAAWGLGELRKDWRIYLAGACVAALGACLFLTNAQIKHWKNAESLFRRALAVTKDNAVAHTNLGLVLYDEGRREEAREQQLAAIRVKPDHFTAYNNLGSILAEEGKHAEAIPMFEKTVSLHPNYVQAHNNLGSAYFILNRRAEAEKHYREALRLDPDFEAAHINLGLILKAMEKYDEAEQHFLRAEQLDSSDVRTYYQIAWLRNRKGQKDSALEYVRRALTLKANDYESNLLMAMLLEERGNAREAMHYYRVVIQLRPQHSGALLGLANYLATAADLKQRNGAEAVIFAERAGESPALRNQPQYLDVLAAAYAQAGRFNEAVTVATDALSKARSAKSDTLAQRLTTRLDSYRAGKVCPAP